MNTITETKGKFVLVNSQATMNNLLLFSHHIDEEYNPSSFSKVMQTLDELHKQLNDMKHRLNEYSSMYISTILLQPHTIVLILIDTHVY